jgi:hypothetical protein
MILLDSPVIIQHVELYILYGIDEYFYTIKVKVAVVETRVAARSMGL